MHTHMFPTCLFVCLFGLTLMFHLHFSIDAIASIVNTFIVLAVIIYYRHMRRVEARKCVLSVVSCENQRENSAHHGRSEWNWSG